MEKINLKKDNFYLIINNDDDLYYYFGVNKGHLNSESLSETIKEFNGKIKSIHIFITDNNIFIENFEINVSRVNEAKSAAFNMLLLNSVNSKEDITFKKVLVKKEENKQFKATVFYTYIDLSKVYDILQEFKADKKIEGIYPLLQLFYDKENFCYNLRDYYYVYMKNNSNIAIFNGIENKELPDDVLFKEIGIDELNFFLSNLNNKLELNFINSGKYEFVEKIFIPFIIVILILNVSVFTYLTFKKSNYNSQLNVVKKQVAQEMKELEPYQKASEKYENLKKVLDAVSRFREASFPFNELVKKLSSVKQIWIRQISLNRSSFLINGKAESAFKVLEIIKKLNFLEDAKINSKIIRDNRGFERFTIRARYKNAFKD